jgi:holliday junction DNA helicase RuvB
MSKNSFYEAKASEDVSFEDTIRPQILDHFIGQTSVKDGLSLYIQAAQKRKDVLDHVLFYGPPGLGKTTLARIIANELNARFYITSGAIIQKPSDLINSLIRLENNDVLFIDEIHRLPKTVEEFLYPALEDFAVDIMMDNKGDGRESQRVDLAKFTIIGATTRAGMISGPLRARFGIDYRMEYYEDNDLRFIAKRTAKVLGINIEDDSAMLIAKCSRGTPRITNRLVRRCQDYVEVKNKDTIALESVKETLRMLNIDENGLDNIDRRIINTLLNVFNGGPVGISSLGAAIDEDAETIETIHEPFLIQQGYIERTPRGRTITNKGRKLAAGRTK